MSPKVLTTHHLEPNVPYDFFYSAQQASAMGSLALAEGVCGGTTYGVEADEWLQHKSTFKGQPYTHAVKVGEANTAVQTDMQHLGTGTHKDAVTTPMQMERDRSRAAVQRAQAALLSAVERNVKANITPS